MALSSTRPSTQSLAATAAVAAGAAIGGVLRMLVGDATHELDLSPQWATAFANVTGSLAIGLAAHWSANHRRHALHALSHPFLLTGVCGGYTTFSILSAETVALLASGRGGLAAVNVVGSLLLAVAAAWLGTRWARRRR